MIGTPLIAHSFSLLWVLSPPSFTICFCLYRVRGIVCTILSCRYINALSQCRAFVPCAIFEPFRVSIENLVSVLKQNKLVSFAYIKILSAPHKLTRLHHSCLYEGITSALKYCFYVWRFVIRAFRLYPSRVLSTSSIFCSSERFGHVAALNFCK